jgi:hypothetical protein
MSKSEQKPEQFGHKLCEHMKSATLTARQILAVPCKTCGAGRRVPCELFSGGLRTEAHRDRKISAGERIDYERTQKSIRQNLSAINATRESADANRELIASMLTRLRAELNKVQTLIVSVQKGLGHLDGHGVRRKSKNFLQE